MRTGNSIKNQLSELRTTIDKNFKQSPLSKVAEILLNNVKSVDYDLDNGINELEKVNKLVNWLSIVVKTMPNSFKDRFYFDSAFIQSIIENWNNKSKLNLTDSIIPKYKYSNEWSYNRLPILPYEQSLFMGIIQMVGEDDLTSVNLLSYPIIYHEIGHELLFHTDNIYKKNYQPHIEKYIKDCKQKTIADKGSALEKAIHNINDIENIWRPSSNHRNWAYEIVIDIISLWCCGPPYMDSLLYEIEKRNANPYYINEEHPPYFTRIIILIRAAEIFGWASYSSKLRNTINKWELDDNNEKWIYDKNRFHYLTNHELLNLAIECGIETCNKINLPKCKPNDIVLVKEKLDVNELPEFGLELIIAAWLKNQDMDSNSYRVWEIDTLRKLNEYIIR